MAFNPKLLMEIQARRGLTNQQLAEAASINFYTLRSYKRGHHGPSEASAKRLAKALDCDVEMFWPDFESGAAR